MNRRSFVRWLGLAPIAAGPVAALATPITGGQIRASSISAERISVMQLSAIDADLGEVTGAVLDKKLAEQIRPGGLLHRGVRG